ncbi:MAG: c-type cytochrome, partial [Candidatus Brocadiia bacterium]
DYSGGGDTGPVLVGLGERFTRSWVEWWLRDPRTLRPMSEMPVYHLKDAEIADLVAYLGGGYGADPYAGLDAPGDAEAGRKLFDDNYCLACHTTDGRALGRKIGPPLDGIASRTPARIPFKDLPAGALDAQTKLDRLAKYLSDVRGFEKVAQRTIAMPNFKLAQKDREPIALFLLSLRSGQLPREMISASPYRKDELRGEILFQRRTCHLCHNIEEITPGLSRAEGMKTSGRIQGPNLFVIGGKVRSGWLPDWLAHPQGVLLNPKMPDPMLAPQDIADLSSYLKMLTAADFELPIALPPADAEVISAGEGFCRGVCYKCHTINGSGVVFGPDLSDIGIKVRPQFIIRWLYRAGDIQPDTAMEDLFIPRDRALIIFRYLETLKQRPR